MKYVIKMAYFSITIIVVNKIGNIDYQNRTK